jgi:hypothetical protein
MTDEQVREALRLLLRVWEAKKELGLTTEQIEEQAEALLPQQG